MLGFPAVMLALNDLPDTPPAKVYAPTPQRLPEGRLGADMRRVLDQRETTLLEAKRLAKLTVARPYKIEELTVPPGETVYIYTLDDEIRLKNQSPEDVRAFERMWHEGGVVTLTLGVFQLLNCMSIVSYGDYPWVSTANGWERVRSWGTLGDAARGGLGWIVSRNKPVASKQEAKQEGKLWDLSDRMAFPGSWFDRDWLKKERPELLLGGWTTVDKPLLCWLWNVCHNQAVIDFLIQGVGEVKGLPVHALWANHDWKNLARVRLADHQPRCRFEGHQPLRADSILDQMDAVKKVVGENLAKPNTFWVNKPI